MKDKLMKFALSWLIVFILTVGVLGIYAQTNSAPEPAPLAYGVTITPDQALKIDQSITSLLPLIPAKYQGYVGGAIMILVLLTKVGRLYTGYKIGGWTGALRAVFTGSATASAPDPATQSAPYKKVGLIALLLVTSLAFSGCTSVINAPAGKALSVSEHVIGLEIASAASTTMSPTIRFGFTSTTVVILPTSTSGPIWIPDYADTFDNSDSSAFNVSIAENLGAGHVSTYVSGITNSALQTTSLFGPYATNYVSK